MDALLALVVGGGIARISLADGSTELLTADSGDVPDGIVVDSGIVYWTTMGAPAPNPAITIASERGLDYSPHNGGVHAMTIDGTQRWDVIADGGITTGKQLTTDDRDRLYWSDREGCRVSSIRKDGTDPADLIVNTRDSEGMQECVGVAVDTEHQYIYWTQKGPSKGGKGRIFRAGLTVPTGETPHTRTDVETLWHDRPEPIDLEISDGWLYWTDRGTPPLGNTLNRAPIPALGAVGQQPEILAGGFREAIGLALDPEREKAYVSDLAGDIHEIAISASGKNSSRVLTSLGKKVTGLAGI